MFNNIAGFVASLVSSTEYSGIILVMIANSLFVPIPAEIALPYAGFKISNSDLSFQLVLLASLLGDFIGALIGYSLGYILNKKVVLKSLKSKGRFLLINESSYHRSLSWLRRYGFPIIFFAKLIPGLKSITSFVSGAAKIDVKKFLILSLLASIIYNSVFILVGIYLQHRWEQIILFITTYRNLAISLAAIGILVFAIKRKGMSRNM
jgi:membrane protein DedA with SNARE-associated domain